MHDVSRNKRPETIKRFYTYEKLQLKKLQNYPLEMVEQVFVHPSKVTSPIFDLIPEDIPCL